ncbi:MAG: hypothetical protein EXR54_08315 [Dehalococcoidia bacterium]|nr:hypothetical protein [Dehalococcoidia bacterium]MSQ17543.1 hypothetical protein [Dehalococcoidia bacterium]
MTQPNRNKPQSVDSRRLKLTNDAGTQGVLLGSCCRQCGICVFGSASFCQSCTGGDLATVELSGQGILYSYTIVRVPPAGWPGPVPYILGQVELSEGPHVLAEIVDCPETGLEIGMAVVLALAPVKTEGSEAVKVVYKFRPQLTTAGASKARLEAQRKEKP